MWPLIILLPFVILLFRILILLSDSVIRQFLVIQYELYYKDTLVNIFRLISSLKNFFKRYIKECKKKPYLCCSLLLQTRLDILESVTKDIGTSSELLIKAEKNTQQTGQPLTTEVENICNAKLKALDLAHNDYKRLAKDEKLVAAPEDRHIIKSYSEDAKNIYNEAHAALMKAYDLAAETVNSGH